MCVNWDDFPDLFALFLAATRTKKHMIKQFNRQKSKEKFPDSTVVRRK